MTDRPSLLAEFDTLRSPEDDGGEEYDRAYIAFRARLAEVEARLPCGHRKIDNDDSYGGCALCTLQRCSLEADDEIEALEAKLKDAAPPLAVSAEALVGGLSDDSISRIMLVANDVERLSHRGGPMTANSPYIAFRVELQRAL